MGWEKVPCAPSPGPDGSEAVGTVPQSRCRADGKCPLGHWVGWKFVPSPGQKACKMGQEISSWSPRKWHAAPCISDFLLRIQNGKHIMESPSHTAHASAEGLSALPCQSHSAEHRNQIRNETKQNSWGCELPGWGETLAREFNGFAFHFKCTTMVPFGGESDSMSFSYTKNGPIFIHMVQFSS